MNWWWLIGVGILCIAVGTGLMIFGQNKQHVESSDKIAKLSKENIELSLELKVIYKEIAATVTGGESFCYLYPLSTFGELNSIDFYLEHMGEYPVYDATIRVWDNSCIEDADFGKIYERHHGYRTKKVTYEEWLVLKDDPKFIRANKEVEKDWKEQMERCYLVQKIIGTVTPKTSINIMEPPLLTFTLPTGINVNTFKQKFGVSLVARNGQYGQEINIAIRNKRFHIYSKVKKISTSSEPVVVREYESDGLATKLIK